MKKRSQELAPTGPGQNATTHAVYSTEQWRRLTPIQQQERARVLEQFGYSERDVPPPPTFSYTVDCLVEAVLIRESYFHFITASGGPLTTKGRQRRAVDGWLKATDRVTKIASTLGLRRVPKPVPTLDELLAGLDEQRDSDLSAGGGEDEVPRSGTASESDRQHDDGGTE